MSSTTAVGGDGDGGTTVVCSRLPCFCGDFGEEGTFTVHSTDVLLCLGDLGEVALERMLFDLFDAVQCISFKFCLTDTETVGTNFLERLVGEPAPPQLEEDAGIDL